MTHEPKHPLTHQASEQQQGERKASIWHWSARIILPMLLIGATAWAFNMLVASKPDVRKRAAREEAYAVEVKVAKPDQYQPSISLFGTVFAARTVELRALVGGEVIWVNPGLAEGQVLLEGEALVRIDAFDYEGAVREARANLAEAKAKLTETRATIKSEEAALERLKEQADFAKRDLERANKLAKSGSLTQQSLENRKLVLSQRQQAMEARSNNLTVLKSRIDQQLANSERLHWRLEQAKRNLDNTDLKAPFTGLVQRKNVDLGRNVSGNDTLVTMYDPDQMDVRFTLSDAQYGRLISDHTDLVGRSIKVFWKLGDVVQSRVAKISRITPEIDATNGGVQVYARLSDRSGLRAGTFVELSVPDKLYTNIIRLPQAAIYDDSRLYMVNEKGRMASYPATIRAYLGEDVLIDASNLPLGEQIITTRIAEAGDGLKVIIPNVKTATNRPQSAKPDGKGSKGEKGQRAKGKRGEGKSTEGKERGKKQQSDKADKPKAAATAGGQS
ncbi:MAG: efflux RND transporter periplasmic adaptor subunit [Cohaesibacter sp.]|nr:efflux RND transporter periplasmic adaptor subunit [Cohaesibacter sp.]